MPQTWQTNGTQKADEVKVDYKDVTPPRPAPQEEDKLTKALQKASARFENQPGHLPHCQGVHCTSHEVMFPRHGDHCLTRTFFKSSKWPRLLMCHSCAEGLQNMKDMGLITAHTL
jgi:hypothetical protein